MNKFKETCCFKPKTLNFWKSLIICFCLLCILGHWLEYGYCIFMDSVFHIVDSDYPVWSDPIYHPYWVYGFGAVFMTLAIEPLKEKIITKRKTIIGAILETLLIAIIISMLLELVFGLLVNQPNEFGIYPYWDNSKLPGNILGQAWIVNDIFIGIGACIYVWIIYPLIYKIFESLKPFASNTIFIIIIIIFLCCCGISYTQLITAGIL